MGERCAAIFRSELGYKETSNQLSLVLIHMEDDPILTASDIRIQAGIAKHIDGDVQEREAIQVQSSQMNAA